MSARQQQIRRIVLTASVASIVVTGAWYGAGLKTRQEVAVVSKTRAELSRTDRLAQLEEKRRHFLKQKADIDQKIAHVEARRLKRLQAEEASRSGESV
ncbi:MAG: hypothetical protein M1838_001671 [Thelocarpon superellum]|nr:MAG: hypothetical protein M1838_001671 [Thelocarpon superellum]